MKEFKLIYLLYRFLTRNLVQVGSNKAFNLLDQIVEEDVKQQVHLDIKLEEKI